MLAGLSGETTIFVFRAIGTTDLVLHVKARGRGAGTSAEAARTVRTVRGGEDGGKNQHNSCVKFHRKNRFVGKFKTIERMCFWKL